MTAKMRIKGGVRKKPHVRMFSRKTAIIGGGGALLAIMGVLMVDPMDWLKGLKPDAAPYQRVEPPPQKMDLEGLPTDYSNNGQASTLNVSPVAAPAPPVDKPLEPPAMDLPKPGVPNGFPPPETASLGGQQASKPKITRKPLGFDGGDDPFDSIANTSQQGQNGQTPQMVSMTQGQQPMDGNASKADKFRGQNRGGADSMFLASQPIDATPKPGYGQITPGTMIQAKLATATNSELGGNVVAMVSSPVYDDATGTCLMIDMKNSKIFGKLSDSVDYGQSRHQAVWKSIHTPKMHLDIGAMDATDAAGRTGIESETNRHYGRLAVAAIGATALDVLGSLGRSGKNSGTEINIGGSAANNVASIGQQIIQRELQVKDTLEQIIGMPVSLMVDRVIELPCLNRR